MTNRLLQRVACGSKLEYFGNAVQPQSAAELRSSAKEGTSMVEQHPTWLRRHHRAVFASLVAMIVVVAGGYALVSAVQNARTVASRSADM